ncbi:DUF6464 family protein [Leptolyngbya sp. AN03gr2]|uniref:DUF6464 family protein n=1 Tax=unclassified Leptolyngbya TaxID=2650499 RepID=UPI003D31121A
MNIKHRYVFIAIVAIAALPLFICLFILIGLLDSLIKMIERWQNANQLKQESLDQLEERLLRYSLMLQTFNSPVTQRNILKRAHPVVRELERRGYRFPNANEIAQQEQPQEPDYPAWNKEFNQGDSSCQWNAHSPYLQCAINPKGSCAECLWYEKAKDSTDNAVL